MSDRKKVNALLGAVGTWARSRGKPRPQTKEGWAALIAQFMAEQPAWHEIPDAHQTHLTYDGATTQIVDTMTQQQFDDDDFAQQVERRNQLLVENDGDELRRDVALQSADRAALAADAPFHNTNPVTAATALLGGTAVVQSGTDSTKAPQIANWVGNDAESRMVAFSFTMQPVDPHFGTADVKPVGFLQFGTRGILSPVVEIDVLVGCIGAVPASQVLLSVGVDPAVSPAAPCSLTISGSLGFDPVHRTTPLTRTVYIDSLLSGTTTAGIAIKPFAKSVTFWRAPVASDVTIEFHNSALGLLYSVVIAGGSILTDPIPLANDVTNIVINASGAGNITHGRLIFNLGL